MPTTPNLKNLPADALAAELTRREEEAQRQQAEAEAAWKAEQAVRAREVLDGWKATEAQLTDDETVDLQNFHEAVLADPVVQAYVTLRRNRYRRMYLRHEAQVATRMLGEDDSRITDLRYWPSTLLEEIATLADTEGQRLAAEESERVMDRLNNPEAS